jgi:PTH1 family peptidyl-tRNA hydrolase
VKVEWIVAGLGNPGPRYDGTRHNVGRMVLREVARRYQATLATTRDNALFGFAEISDVRVCLALPLRFMNESGLAIAPLARFFKVPVDRVLVLFDDLDLPVGKVRARTGGGSGGNRGASSIISAFGSDAYPRVRVGISRPPPGWEAADYVLSKFSAEELPLVESAVERAADAVEVIITDGIEAAMNAFN